MKKTTLKNGLTVITKNNEGNVSSMLTYWVKAGGNHEKNYPYGIAHFLEHMMFKGTKNRSKEQIKEAIDEIGGVFNATTSAERTNYYTIVPYTEWKVGTEVLTDMMFSSVFPEDEIEKEKKVILEEIKRSEDDPSGYAYRAMIEHFMKDRPERQSVLGSPETVTSVTREDFVSFVDAFYQPSNMVFVATGNINHEELCSLLEEITPKSSKEVDAAIEHFVPFELGGETITLEKDTKQANLRWAIFGPDGHKKDAYVFEIIGTILGGSMSSRFFKTIREERGLAYSVNAGYIGNDDYGTLMGYVGTDPSKLEEVKEVITAELEKLKTELVSEKELNKVKNLEIGRFLVSQDSKQNINYNLAMQHLYGLGEEPKEYAKKIKSVTSEDIMRVANEYFGKEKFLFVEVVPPKKL